MSNIIAEELVYLKELVCFVVANSEIRQHSAQIELQMIVYSTYF